ncbi:hypothetical protein POM88_051872 [Heracleum sosnowskyi]|uniref:Uncharacterized protein n=1 Tax=Heracleum sosnowskyi TaxID=360622 RepID=A0AAD8LYX6_9APIA|nr:hypothetical protein POM88_051872 [Heracleum sosnowskyi]
MQGGQGTMSSVMEAAANVAASAKSGFDKTKAVVEEKKQPAAVAAPDHPPVKSQCLVPTDSFVVEDVGSHCPVKTPGTEKVGSAENASDTNSTGNANVGGTEVVDANPTHTGMPAPVVEPDGVGSGFKTETNTGSGTHFAMNYK